MAGRSPERASFSRCAGEGVTRSVTDEGGSTASIQNRRRGAKLSQPPSSAPLRGAPSPAQREKEVAAFLTAAAARFRDPAPHPAGLAFGVDLGTATVVLTAVDAAGRPVYWDALPCEAIRDGVVVNFADAVAAARKLKRDAEDRLGCRITDAATAHPPAVPAADCRACRFVLENAEIACRALVDEVSAAQALLRIEDGAIADVGGGSTGVGIVRGGQVTHLSDLPGGGHHLDLILAGALKIPIEEAERRKRTAGADFSDILRAGVERIAISIQRQIGGEAVAAVHLVGGALRLRDAGKAVTQVTGLATRVYPHAELVTPFGIALSP